ncbi:MAG: imidazole glycerol phosphate synthase subunit HisF [Gammaproteobacteria bacterium]|nr:imidazole glycerol phosphate synthase subunit HisF [Gammaproteobacteria bacterium]
MLSKRVVACLDVKDGELAKSVKFVDTKTIGDPVEKAKEYYEGGLDELVFYDITASSDKRNIMLDVVSEVAKQIFIPFSVGGGIRTLEDINALLRSGVEKINVNSAAVKLPTLIDECAGAIGRQNTVLSMDVRRVESMASCPSGFEIVINGGRTPMGLDAVAWAKEGVARGAGELVVNSIDGDGTRDGYDLVLTRTIAEAVPVPVVASGGAGHPEHLREVLTEGKADAALVASMVHYGDFTIRDIKRYLYEQGVKVRLQF